MRSALFMVLVVARRVLCVLAATVAVTLTAVGCAPDEQHPPLPAAEQPSEVRPATGGESPEARLLVEMTS